MKKIIREYFQLFQANSFLPKDEKRVDSLAIIIGLLVSPLAIVFILISFILTPVRKWLEN